MRILAGASGYSFKEWRGTFYPEKMKPEEMLPFYSARLPTVEINSTFYRFPRANVVEEWARVTPDAFRFSIKASRRITHIGRLKAESVADGIGYIYDNLVSLGPKRGPVLFLSEYQGRLTDLIVLSNRATDTWDTMATVGLDHVLD